ncbi:MAG TPA: helix-turn-helix domain-containing protein [Phenylobacterium sp.]
MQTAHSEEWRPGFAKRAENFSEVCAQAEGWRWSPGESIARVAAAVLKGTPILTIPQRMTLLLYVEHLNQDRLEQDIACVWPSTALIAEYLGCSESQARANRRALEAAGYLLRDYTRANRPAGIEAYDLRPLMARLEALEGVDETIRQAQAARRAAYAETVVFPMKYSARAPESRRLEQSHENLKSSV